MREYEQFILWKFVQVPDRVKPLKVPVDYRTGRAHSPHDPYIWLSYDAAVGMVGGDYMLGFTLTENDPYFLFDLDNCLVNGAWTPEAMDVVNRLPGAMVEVSSSGQGLHVIGSCTKPLTHGKKNPAAGFELYTENRFLAFGDMVNATGDSSVNLTDPLLGLIEQYFNNHNADGSIDDWTYAPLEHHSPLTDEELLAKALNAKSAASTFGTSATFRDLWECNEEALIVAYPDNFGGGRAYDGSNVDGALAMMLAFWTGCDCERVLNLMKQSALVRDKWDRDTYIVPTVLTACKKQTEVYSIPKPVDDIYDAGDLKAASGPQRDFALTARANILDQCDGDAELMATLCAQREASFWIDHQTKTPQDIAAMLTETYTERGLGVRGLLSGFQYVDATKQLEHFDGCYYVQQLHQVYTPRFGLLSQDRFRAVFGGFVFQKDESGKKTTNNAWEAFTESQVCVHPVANAAVFRPDMKPGEYFLSEGEAVVNMFKTPYNTRAVGDVTPFLRHVEKLLPDERDRAILLSYMAAVVQYQGVKFMWAPFIQGVPGNGKTLLSKVVARSVGRNYAHWPKADDIDNKFNQWLWGNILICVEDINISSAAKRDVFETIKTMITSDEGIEIQGKGADQFSADICCNLMLNGNHKSGVPKTQNDRRIAVFYTAQQDKTDLVRDGMGGDYFPNLYHWLKGGGYQFMAEYLHTYPIPEEFNPALGCHRAPDTSSHTEAVQSGYGVVEQEVLEAAEEGRPGFRGGWVSSIALAALLDDMRIKIPRIQRRQMLSDLGYEWHPALEGSNGRAGGNSIIDDNKRPTLFIKSGSIAAKNITDPRKVLEAYISAQTATSDVVSVFGSQEATT